MAKSTRSLHYKRADLHIIVDGIDFGPPVKQYNSDLIDQKEINKNIFVEYDSKCAPRQKKNK